MMERVKVPLRKRRSRRWWLWMSWIFQRTVHRVQLWLTRQMPSKCLSAKFHERGRSRISFNSFRILDPYTVLTFFVTKNREKVEVSYIQSHVSFNGHQLSTFQLLSRNNERVKINNLSHFFFFFFRDKHFLFENYDTNLLPGVTLGRITSIYCHLHCLVQTGRGRERQKFSSSFPFHSQQLLLQKPSHFQDFRSRKARSSGIVIDCFHYFFSFFLQFIFSYIFFTFSFYHKNFLSSALCSVKELSWQTE